MEKILLLSVLISMIQYYIYSTNVIWEYLNEVSKILKFEKAQIFFHGILLVGPAKNQKNYLDFLNQTYGSFFTKLISCPICTGFWLSLMSSVYCGNLLFFAPIAYCSICLYFFIKFLTNKVGTI